MHGREYLPGGCQVVVEFEGVVVEDTSDLHAKAWLQLADEEGKSRPLQFALKGAEGMKNEQVCTQQACEYTLHSGLCICLLWTAHVAFDST